MNTIFGYMTKKNTLILSLVFIGIPVFIYIFQTFCDYDSYQFCRDVWRETGLIGGIALVPALLFFVPNTIAILMKTAVFDAWKRFALWAVPLITGITAFLGIASESGPYGFSMGITPLVLMVVYIWYIVHSSIVIVRASRRNRK
jgi:hypothetical protein